MNVCDFQNQYANFNLGNFNTDIYSYDMDVVFVNIS